MRNFGRDLHKALTASSGSGAALVPEDLEPIIRANLLELSPLARMVPVVQADGSVHSVVRRTANNAAAWFEGEMTDANYSQSTYARRAVEVKILRTHGQASDFMVSASRSFTDVLADEIESATEGMADLFEFSTLWGISDDLSTRAFTGDGYQYTGAYGWVLEDAAGTNVLDLDGVITLSTLDSLIDVTAEKYRNARNLQWLFVMSPQMRSKVSGLQTLVRRSVTTVEFEGGMVMETYRDIPILTSGFVRPSSSTTSPDVTAAPAGSGGSIGLSTGNYMYKIASITMYGEQVAGAADTSNSVTASTHDSVDLTWTADTNAKLYAIYRTNTDEADSDGNYDLIDIIAAKTYSATGAVTGNVTSYSDTGESGLAEVHPLASNDEAIFLVGLGRDQGISRPVLTARGGTPLDELVNYVPLSETTDSVQFRLRSYHTLQVPWGHLHGVIRRASAS